MPDLRPWTAYENYSGNLREGSRIVVQTMQERTCFRCRNWKGRKPGNFPLVITPPPPVEKNGVKLTGANRVGPRHSRDSRAYTRAASENNLQRFPTNRRSAQDLRQGLDVVRATELPEAARPTVGAAAPAPPAQLDTGVPRITGRAWTWSGPRSSRRRRQSPPWGRLRPLCRPRMVAGVSRITGRAWMWSGGRSSRRRRQSPTWGLLLPLHRPQPDTGVPRITGRAWTWSGPRSYRRRCQSQIGKRLPI